MFGLFKPKVKIEVGQIWESESENPFMPVWCHKIVEIKEKDGYRWIRYEAWQKGTTDMPHTTDTMAEKTFRWYGYKLA